MSIRSKEIVYTYPPLSLRVLVRIPHILRLRFELLVQAPLESALATAIEALLAPTLVVHAGDVGFITIEAIYSVQHSISAGNWARGRHGSVALWFCGLGYGHEMPGCLSMHLSSNFICNPLHISTRFAWHKCRLIPSVIVGVIDDFADQG
jgi:hypothetical protein